MDIQEMKNYYRIYFVLQTSLEVHSIFFYAFSLWGGFFVFFFLSPLCLLKLSVTSGKQQLFSSEVNDL